MTGGWTDFVSRSWRQPEKEKFSLPQTMTRCEVCGEREKSQRIWRDDGDERFTCLFRRLSYNLILQILRRIFSKLKNDTRQRIVKTSMSNKH